jgi:hypothetical protein
MEAEVFELTPVPKPRRWKRGTGTVAYSESGELFINSELIGMSAMTAFLCCSQDGTGFIASQSKVLVPVDWAIREKPDLKEDLLLLCKMAAESTRPKDGSSVV